MSSYHWKRLGERQALYRYEPYWQPAAPDPAAIPVVLLQPLPPETGTPLAEKFRADGLAALYAIQVTDTDEAAVQMLDSTLAGLLKTHHPRSQAVVLVGCASGGMLGYRYVRQGGSARVSFLFTIGSQHRSSQLTALGQVLFEGRAGQPMLHTEVAPTAGNTVIVNLHSERTAARLGPENQPAYLEDAANESLPLEEEALCRDRAAYAAMRRYLAGDLLLVSVCLKSLTMRGSVGDNGQTGPFCFEVNGHRAPFDGAFRVPVETAYTFDPARAQLGTLTFPATAGGKAVTFDFRLKDLSSVPGQPRRKLLTSLHTSLRDGLVAEHTLQDSLGSVVGIQVRCMRPPALLEANHES